MPTLRRSHALQGTRRLSRRRREASPVCSRPHSTVRIIKKHVLFRWPKKKTALTNDARTFPQPQHLPAFLARRSLSSSHARLSLPSLSPSSYPSSPLVRTAHRDRHAGYSYSGPAAAWGYKNINPDGVARVFLLGPSHHVFLRKCALSSAGGASYDTLL